MQQNYFFMILKIYIIIKNEIRKNLLNKIIRKRLYLNNIYKNMDKIVVCLLKQMNNEINIKEDIYELIKNISWNVISLP